MSMWIKRCAQSFLAATLAVVSVSLELPARASASACNPNRPGTAYGPIHDGAWVRPTGNWLGGVYGSIVNQLPYTTISGNAANSGWVMLQNNSNGNEYAQAGWYQTGPTTSNMWAEALGGSLGSTPWDYYGSGAVTGVAVTYSVQTTGNGTFTFWEDGTYMSQVPTGFDTFGYDQLEDGVFATETHKLPDEMGGGRSDKEQFSNLHVYYNNAWNNFGMGTPAIDQPVYALNQDTVTSAQTWDRYCPLSFGPAASVSPSFSQQDVFWQGRNQSLSEGWWVTSWNGPSQVNGGPLGSQPSDAFTTDGSTQVVFWQGTDNALWEMWYAGGWNGPAKVNNGPLASAPSAITTPGNQEVYWRGTDDNLWEMWYSGGWNGPAKVATTTMASAPGAAAGPGGTQYVFWKGSNGHLWETWYGGTWSTPADLGFSSMLSAPTALVNPTNGNQYVYWQGTDLYMHQAVYNGTWTSSTLTSLGQVGAAPSVVYNGQGLLFWKGTDNNLWESMTSGSWVWGGAFIVNGGTLGLLG